MQYAHLVSLERLTVLFRVGDANIQYYTRTTAMSTEPAPLVVSVARVILILVVLQVVNTSVYRFIKCCLSSKSFVPT